MRTLWQDLRYAVRMLWKNPGFTLVAITTLALGIGANTAIFSVVNAVLLRPLPFHEPERLVVVQQAKKGDTGGVSYPNLLDWQKENRVFESIAVFNSTAVTLTGDDEAVRLTGAVASADLFPVLGATPLLGRTFLPEEDKLGGGSGGIRPVVLSYGFWQRRFNADKDVLGQTITLDDALFTVIGVMPEGFKFPIQSDPVDVWVSVATDAEPSAYGGTIPTSRGYMHYDAAIARLKPNITLAQAQAGMDALARNIAQQHPGATTYTEVKVTPGLELLVGEVRPVLLLLFGAVACVLLIGCVNVANLLLARSTVRRKEFAIRAALGAGRWRIVRQLLTESVLLACMGGVLGLLLAVWGVDLLVTFAPQEIPRLNEISLDGRVLAFTLFVSLVTGVVFGLAPALAASKSDVNEVLKDGGRSSTEGASRRRLRGMLIVTEIAVALVLLVGAGLLINSFVRLRTVNPGFNAHNVLTFNLDLPVVRYPIQSSQVSGFYTRLTERLQTLPGVTAVSTAQAVPLSGNNNSTTVEVEGRAGERQSAKLRFISLDYFRAMSIPLLQGRDFTSRDDSVAPSYVIINETFARRFLPDENPLGKRLSLGWGGDKPKEIIGVVKDVKHESLSAERQPEMYVPQAQFPINAMTVIVRMQGDPLELVAAVRHEVRMLDKDLPLSNIKTLDAYLYSSVTPQRFITLLLAVFAGIALTLTAVGLYGVMAYSVTQRTHEIGIRMALGAQTSDVLKMIVKQGMMLALVGVAVGLAGAFAATRVMASLLYGVSATDPVTFIGVAMLLTTVALLACYIPARRATKVDPMVALRYE